MSSKFLLDLFKKNLTNGKGSTFSIQQNPTNYIEKMRGSIDPNLLFSSQKNSSGTNIPTNPPTIPTFYLLDSLGRILTTENGSTISTQ